MVGSGHVPSVLVRRRRLKSKPVIPCQPVTWTLGVYDLNWNLIRDVTPLPHNTNGANTNAIGTATGSGLLVSNCDLTTLLNGVYNLQLSVVGAYAQTNASVVFRLESNSQSDLCIRVAGIPLTVVRTYNSRLRLGKRLPAIALALRPRITIACS